MFIDKMSSKELFLEYTSDLDEINIDTHTFDESKYVGDYLWKHRKSQCVTIQRYTNTKRGNRYLGLLMYRQEGAGKLKKWEWVSFHVGFMPTDKGTMTLIFFGDQKIAVSFSPHFFNRYRERMLEYTDDWRLRARLSAADSLEKIVAIYIGRNLGVSWVETTSVYKNKTHIFAPIPDGVALLQWDSKLKRLQGNTFIVNDMLDEKQLYMLQQSIDYYKLSPEERSKVKAPSFISENDESS